MLRWTETERISVSKGRTAWLCDVPGNRRAVVLRSDDLKYWRVVLGKCTTEMQTHHSILWGGDWSFYHTGDLAAAQQFALDILRSQLISGASMLKHENDRAGKAYQDHLSALEALS